MVRPYQNNPQLNAQRSQVRVTDENVPRTCRGCAEGRLTGSGYQYSDNLAARHLNVARSHPITGAIRRAAETTITQTLFRQQQTANRTRAAEGGFPARAKRCVH